MILGHHVKSDGGLIQKQQRRIVQQGGHLTAVDGERDTVDGRNLLVLAVKKVLDSAPQSFTAAVGTKLFAWGANRNQGRSGH